MKRFDLNEYKRLKKEGEEPKIVTRDGREARIICTDRKGCQPIVALVHDNEDDLELLFTYLANGCSVGTGYDSSEDLFFASIAPTKHKGWVNVFNNGLDYWCSSIIYKTEDEAKKIGGCVTTVSIEWEERL